MNIIFHASKNDKKIRYACYDYLYKIYVERGRYERECCGGSERQVTQNEKELKYQ